MKTSAKVIRSALQIALHWLVSGLSMSIIAWLLPGIRFAATDSMPRWAVIALAVLLIAIANNLVRPIVLRFTRPLGWVGSLLVGFLLSAATILLTASLLPGFAAGFASALLAGITLAWINSLLSGVLHINDTGSWYQRQIRKQALKRPFDASGDSTRGLMLVEIDGLSYWHLRKALDEGRMPTLQAMIDEDGYELSRVDCGLPSMTSSCQAGIMFGDNYDIPAYRWYDKSKQKLYVSANDAPELNSRYAHGQGLMRGGSSILNMFNGDAKTSLFTMANMFKGDAEDKKDRADDISTLVLNPYFLSRALFLFIADFIRELWEGLRQRVKNVQPRLNRLAEYYPFVRAAMCGMMREMSTNIAILQMYRGAPVIYMLYLGYDEVAHHSGPWSTDAFGDLGRLDNSLAELRKVTKGATPRPYEFIILSDHGQSYGATFKQRYGLSIKDFIVKQLPEGTTVAQSIGGDRGGSSLRGVAEELKSVSESKTANLFDKVTAKQGEKLARRGVEEEDGKHTSPEASVNAYGSGNACQVYFDLHPRKIKLSELETAYPGMVDALVAHEGIGLVCAHEDDGRILALGKNGRRDLNTGEVSGQDPLQPYVRESGPGTATLEKRVWQLKRVMEFPSAGDLWVMGTWYADGTVAALEELIGNHGGLGGEQTDAFLFHPPDLVVPDTRNATDVYAILNGRRESDS